MRVWRPAVGGGVWAWAVMLLAPVVSGEGPRSHRVSGGVAWVWAAVVLASAVVAAEAVRPNVVDEVPRLDVGPLVGVTVARGDTARLPCRQPHYPDDTLNLVLWYLNHTTRPFLSYDARARVDLNDTTTNVSSNSISSLRHRYGNGTSSSSKAVQTIGERRYLEGGGTRLVVREVRPEDQAEYRCLVHYRLSPTWTQRLLLLVPETVESVELEDETGRVVGNRLPPLAEEANLTLTCRASHGSAKVASLSWLLEGEEVDTSWSAAGEDVAVNQLEVVGVEQRQHREAHLTCRLTTVSDSGSGHTPANITHRSTIITMFHVPEASLRAEGGRAGVAGGERVGVGGGGRPVGGGREVREGEGITLLCTVRADPPAYNITWLHNGRVVSVGGRRWMRDNASLVVSPVERGDAGLYTCLASNREGDGHSNAVPIRVTHPPYCLGRPQEDVVVASNTSVTLTCLVEATPQDLKFTWKLGSPTQGRRQQHQGKEHPGPPHIGDLPAVYVEDSPPDDLRQGATDLLQGPTGPLPNPSLLPASGQESWGVLQPEEEGAGSEEMQEEGGAQDPAHPGRSTLTFTPTASTIVRCFARNSLGHIRVPCSYNVTVVEPPRALRECAVSLVGVTSLEVKCQDPAHAHDRHAHTSTDAAHVHHSPSLSFVRSPEASTRANLEVWSGPTLVANISEGSPQFRVRGLPPATDLRLVLYTATPHARSTPLYMYTRTLAGNVVHFTVPPPTRPESPRPQPDPPSFVGVLGWQVVGGVGGAGVVLLLVGAALGVRACSRRRAATAAAAGVTGSNSQDQHLQQQMPRHVSLDTMISEDSTWVPDWRSSSI